MLREHSDRESGLKSFLIFFALIFIFSQTINTLVETVESEQSDFDSISGTWYLVHDFTNHVSFV